MNVVGRTILLHINVVYQKKLNLNATFREFAV